MSICHESIASFSGMTCWCLSYDIHKKKVSDTEFIQEMQKLLNTHETSEGSD